MSSDRVHRPSGRIRLCHVDTRGNRLRVHPWGPNDVLSAWASIAGLALTKGGVQYALSMMYLEFENLASPGDPISLPTFDPQAPASGVEYYDGLVSSPSRDYLRVPIIAATLDSTDETIYPDGNRMTFFAQSSGLVGVHGKPFTNGSNSTVFGGALVMAPATNDPTQDLVFSRSYSTPNLGKPPTGQVGLDWEITLQ